MRMGNHRLIISSGTQPLRIVKTDVPDPPDEGPDIVAIFHYRDFDDKPLCDVLQESAWADKTEDIP